MKKILFIMAVLLLAGVVQARTYETPLTDQARRELVKELAQDAAFAEMFMQALVSQVMEEAPVAGQPMGGMELPAVPAPAESRAPDGMIAGGSSGMEGDSGLVAPATGRVLVNGKIPEKSALLKRTVTKASSGAKEADLFISLSCRWCKEFWDKLRADPKASDHLLEDQVNVWLMPHTDREAAMAMLFEYIQAQDPEKALSFLDAAFRRDFSGSDQETFLAVDQWLGANGLGSLQDLRDDRNLVEAIGARLKGGLDRANRFGVGGYPSVYADGVEDRAYFLKISKGETK